MKVNIFCHLLGHKWRYKDYTNSIKTDGAKYRFTQVRRCLRCNEHQYRYDKWVTKDLLLPEDKQPT